jgi:multiple antibiotic resistance protein
MNDALTISALTFGAQAFVTLFVILDPPGAAPIFLSLASGKSIKVQRKLAWQAATVSLVVIVTFALFGNALLNYLNISLAALQGAGGILLLITGLGLLTGSLTDEGSSTSKKYCISSPRYTTSCRTWRNCYHHVVCSKGRWLISIRRTRASNNRSHFIIGLTFMFSTNILAVIKDSGVTLLARIAGLLLSAIAVEMIVSSVKAFFNIA